MQCFYYLGMQCLYYLGMQCLYYSAHSCQVHSLPTIVLLDTIGLVPLLDAQVVT